MSHVKGDVIPRQRFVLVMDAPHDKESNPHGAIFRCFEFWLHPDPEIGWVYDPFWYLVLETPYGLAVDFQPITDDPYMSKSIEASVKDTKESKSYYAPFVVCGLIAALACRNVTTAKHAAPPKLNAARAKRGKPPLCDYHVLELLPTHGQGHSTAMGSNGHGHASPRLHVRRGHVRMVRGERPTWVKEHMVGSADLGFVKKDYAGAQVMINYRPQGVVFNQRQKETLERLDRNSVWMWSTDLPDGYPCDSIMVKKEFGDRYPGTQ